VVMGPRLRGDGIMVTAAVVGRRKTSPEIARMRRT
jgi:hypothetical protein